MIFKPKDNRTDGFNRSGDNDQSMSHPLSRRQFVAAAVPGLLAGCLVESEESGTESGAGTDGSETETGESAATDDGTDDRSSGSDSATSQQTDDEAVPDEVGPDGSGLIVTDVDVLSVTDGGYRTTVDARLTVENAGRFVYGTIELRADAYATRPHSSDRDAVGYATVRRHFRQAEPFEDGTREFTVSISFRSRETRARADPDWYEVDAAVRRAEPV